MLNERIGLANAISRLSTTKSEFEHADGCASFLFGNTRIYAADEVLLEKGVSALKSVVSAQLCTHFLLSKNAIGKVVRDYLEMAPNRALLAAILGKLRRLGEVDAIVGSTESQVPSLCFFHASRAGEIRQALAITFDHLKAHETLSIRQVQVRFFPSKPWASYAAASALLAALAWRGLATQVDKDLYAWPQEVHNAAS